MSKFKAAAGLFVMIGIPLALGAIFAALGYGYAQQHVHKVWAEVDGGRAVLKTSDYYHSIAGVVAIAGALAFAWVVITIMAVLAGGNMIASRDKNWE